MYDFVYDWVQIFVQRLGEFEDICDKIYPPSLNSLRRTSRINWIFLWPLSRLPESGPEKMLLKN